MSGSCSARDKEYTSGTLSTTNKNNVTIFFCLMLPQYPIKRCFVLRFSGCGECPSGKGSVKVGMIVGVKVKIKFTPEQATKAHRGSKGIALLFL